jgi:hypothetical protein
MSKYVDSDFGFSFWYPSSSTVNEIPLRGFSKSDQQIIKRLSVVVSGQEIWIDEVDSPSRTFNVEAGACGYCGPVRYFFDTELHSWMKVYPSGLNGAPDATPDQMTASKMPKLADISNNTMGGLHIFSTEQKENASIVPLSAKHFLEIIEPSGKNPGSNIQIPLVKTVVATDPTVAVPVSMEKQIQFIRDEASTYSH